MRPLWAFISGWLLVPVTVVGNGLVIFLITTRRNLRTTTNWFVLSLAVADFGVGAVYYPRVSFCAIFDETCVNEAVKIAFCIGTLCCYASVTNLCALTLDRYLAIVHPLRYVTFMTNKRVPLLISAAWIIANLDLVSNVLFYFVLSGKPKQAIKQVRLVLIPAISLGACVFLLFATVRILLVVRRIAKQNAAVVAQLNFNHKLHHGVAFKARETASAKMIGILVTVFLVCYSVDTADHIIFLNGSLLPEIVIEIYLILTLLNSAVNPVVYAFHKREINRELKRLFRFNNRGEGRQLGRNRRTKEKPYELGPFRNPRESKVGRLCHVTEFTDHELQRTTASRRPVGGSNFYEAKGKEEKRYHGPRSDSVNNPHAVFQDSGIFTGAVTLE